MYLYIYLLYDGISYDGIYTQIFNIAHGYLFI